MIKFLTKNNKCIHDKISPLTPGEFCPDCGAEIKISWQLLRCDCCLAKRKFNILRNKIVPEDKFCKNCGSAEYYLETKERPEFFDYGYAVILKEEIRSDFVFKETVQIWIEEENVRERENFQKMLPVFCR